jgi:hypothetical protein
MPPKTKRVSVPESMLPHYEATIALTDALCAEKLNGEYAQLCREMTATLARKRPSPLVTEYVNTWACAIIYTIGAVNFLFDKTQKPHLRADELCAWFDVAKSTGGSKSAQIKKFLNIGMMEPRWTLPSRMEDNFMAWSVMLNDFIVDARDLPRELQEEAYRKGLIPYLPPEKDTE